MIASVLVEGDSYEALAASLRHIADMLELHRQREGKLTGSCDGEWKVDEQHKPARGKS